VKSASGVGSGDGFENGVEEFLVKADCSVNQAADNFCKEFHSRSGIRRQDSGFRVVGLVLASLSRVGRGWPRGLASGAR